MGRAGISPTPMRAVLPEYIAGSTPALIKSAASASLIRRLSYLETEEFIPEVLAPAINSRKTALSLVAAAVTVPPLSAIYGLVTFFHHDALHS